MFKSLRVKVFRNPKRLINISLLILIAICLVVIIFTYPLQQGEQVPAITFTNVLPPMGTMYDQYVDLSGAVIHPGLYKINDHTRVGELIDVAGGFTTDADANFIAKNINLAKILADQDKVYIPLQSQPASVSTDSKISINNASKAQLTSLPGVGDSLADRIIAARPYTDINQLKDVSGIGESKFAQFSQLISL